MGKLGNLPGIFSFRLVFQSVLPNIEKRAAHALVGAF